MRRFLLVFLLALPVLARPQPSLADFVRLAGTTHLEKPAVYLAAARPAKAIFLKQGGLVDLPPDVPTVILPDLHAQRDYLLQVLHMKVAGGPVWQQLQSGKINLLCLGDAMHSERAQGRWMQAEREALAGGNSPSMEAELVESLGLLRMIMQLKTAFPSHFFFVRGNHEDMDPTMPYRKFTRVGESTLVRDWVARHFGTAFLQEWHAIEGSLPLAARGGSFVGSHSPPESPLTLAGISSRSNAAFRACTWSDNTLWVPRSPQEQAFEANARLLQVSAARPWVCGHRKVLGALYRSQCGGKILQINPLDSDPRVYVLAPPRGQALQPARDVHKVP